MPLHPVCWNSLSAHQPWKAQEAVQAHCQWHLDLFEVLLVNISNVSTQRLSVKWMGGLLEMAAASWVLLSFSGNRFRYA